MKRVAAVAVIAVASAVAAWFYFRPTGADSGTAPVANSGFTPRSSDPFDAPAPPARGDSSLHGTVVGPDGRPAAGVTVIAVEAEGEALSAGECICDGEVVHGSTMLDCSCRPRDEIIIALVARREGEPQLLARGVSDEKGAFELVGLPKEPVGLWAQHASLGVSLRERVKPDEHPELILGPPITLSGEVTDEKKKPLAKTLITVVVTASSRFFEALTDEKGTFKIGGLPPAQYVVIAAHQGKRSDLSYARAEDPTVSFELRSPLTVRGRVVRQGAPVAGAEVVLGFDHEPRVQAMRSAADGTFAFADVAEGTPQLSASDENDYASLRLYGDDGSPRDIVLNLKPAGRIDGSVVDVEGHPVNGVSISAYSDDETTDAQRSDAAGRFSFRLPPAAWELVASREGYLQPEPVNCTVRAGEVATIELKLDHGARLVGRVVDPAGQPVENAQVKVDTRSRGDDTDNPSSDRANTRPDKTRADGVFKLEAVEPGPTRLIVKHRDWQVEKLTVDAPNDRLEIKLRAGGSLEGHVRESDGSALAGVEVAVFPDAKIDRRKPTDELQDPKTTRTAGDGSYHLHGLTPRAYIVTAAEKGNSRIAFGHADVTEGTATADLVFEPGLTLAGKVVDQDGAPVPRVHLTVIPTQTPEPDDDKLMRRQTSLTELVKVGSHRRSMEADEAGHFISKGLSPGRVELQLWAQGYVLDGTVKANAGDEDLTVTMRRAPHLKGRVVSSDRAPVKRFFVDGEAVTADDGAFDVTRESPGDVDITAAGYAPLKLKRDPEEKGDADLGTITLSTGRTIDLHVTDLRTGAPIVGANAEGVPYPLVSDDELGRDVARAMISDANGHLLLKQQGDGELDVRVDRDGYLGADVKVPPDATQLEVTLDPGESITGHVVDAKGRPVTKADVSASNADGAGRGAVGADGSYQLKGLQAGTWLVHVNAYATKVTFMPKQLTLEAGKPAVADFKALCGDATLEVVVSDASGDEVLVDLYLLPGTVAAPQNIAGYRLLGDQAIDGERDGTFSALEPGRYTVFVSTHLAKGVGVYRQAIDVASGSQTVRVTLPSQLPELRYDESAAQ